MTEPKSMDEILAEFRRTSVQSTTATDETPGLERLSNHSVLQLYESIRKQVDADRSLGDKYRFVGDAAKESAERLKHELQRRGLTFTAIDWR